uniref:Small ribosomal subunit protein uS2c n=1 Tax=Lobochlamys culleus TaxID=51693 RepID=A0A0S2IDR4_9CHLO|nr:ribosomal protein S2 [Lobochlamys culleus]
MIKKTKKFNSSNIKQKQASNINLKINSKKKSSLKLGNIYTFKITAIGANNIGIDEFSYNYSILIPNTQIGDVVKAKIVKIQCKKYKYAVGQVVKKLKSNLENKVLPSFSVGDALDVTVTKIGPKNTGIVEFPNNYLLIIPNAIPGQKLKVQITRIKSKFGFAKALNIKSNLTGFGSISKANHHLASISSTSLGNMLHSAKSLKEGSKINFVLPKTVKSFKKATLKKKEGLIKTSGKTENNFVLKLNDASSTNVSVILFITETLGAKPGDRVKVQLVKVLNVMNGGLLNPNRTKFAIGKIIQVNPINKNKKMSLVRGTLRQMLKSEMHFGEKVVKVNARMKKYIWLRKKGQNKNKAFIQNGRNIINLLKTRRCLNKALMQLSKYAVKGRTFLFLGTKKPAAELIKKVSLFTKNSFFVNTRWIGGMLTNWKSIKKSIQKISPILKEKQAIINAILEKRQNIRKRLLKKGLVLRKKSKLLIKKARALLLTLKNEKNKALLNKKQQNLSIKRNQLIQRSEKQTEKYNKLIDKKAQLSQQSLILKQKAAFVANKYKNLFAQLKESKKKLKELTTLFVIGKEIVKLQQSAKDQNNRIGVISSLVSDSVQAENATSLNKAWVLPNPPQEVVNKIVQIFSFEDYTNLLGKITPPAKSFTELKNNQETQKVLILSKLLSEFSSFVPLIRSSIKTQRENIKDLEQKLLKLVLSLKIIKTKITNYASLNNKLKLEVNKIKIKLSVERKIIRRLRRKIKQLAAQKKLIAYLPKLRYLPTPQIKITETVKYLMKNIVDPKLKYPIDLIYDQRVKNQSKKVGAARKKKWQRLEKYFGGISKMTKMKRNQISKIVAVIIGQQEQINAVRECKKLGIKMFNIVDTNCNPSLADHFIPANDDSRNSIKYILTAFLTRIKLAEKLRLRFKKPTKKVRTSFRTNTKQRKNNFKTNSRPSKNRSRAKAAS